ncbi:MAG: hypothetical protein AB8G05_14970 [Oligoflexales bacterium]
MKNIFILVSIVSSLFSEFAIGGTIFSQISRKELKFIKGYEIYNSNLNDAENFTNFLDEQVIPYAINLGWRTEPSMATVGKKLSDEDKKPLFTFYIGTAGSIEYTYDDLKQVKDIIEYWAETNYIGIDYDHINFPMHYFCGHDYNLKHIAMRKGLIGGNNLLFALNNVDNLEPINFDRARLPLELNHLSR